MEAPLETAVEGPSTGPGPKVPPRRNGCRVKKGASSGSSKHSGSVAAAQPMAGDDCAINDLLEGRTDLCLVLPDERHIIVNVERRTPVMDLLVQVATAHKINPSNHTIQVSNERGCKANTPVGSLDVKELFIVPKVSSGQELSHKRPPRRQPFEPTFRLQVRLPKNQLMVLRVNLSTKLGQVKHMVCEDKGLDPQGYQLVAIGRLPVAPLDLSLTLEQYGSTELALMSNKGLAATIQNTATDLISYSMTKECKKGIIGLLTHHRSKGSLTGSSSDGVSSRGASPVRAEPPCPPEEPPSVPSRGGAKKRPAPAPPLPSSREESRVATTSSKGESKEPGLRTHSRQSSDSSGYHEASVLSDLPETPSPETVCSSSGACSLDSPPQSLEGNRPRRGSRKPRPSSTASDASGGKKRRAPPPPPLSSQSSQSPGTEPSNGQGTTTPVSQDKGLVRAWRSPEEPGTEEEKDSLLSTPKGDSECGRADGPPPSCTEPMPLPRLTLQRKKGSLDTYDPTKVAAESLPGDETEAQSSSLTDQLSPQSEREWEQDGAAMEREVPKDAWDERSRQSWEEVVPEPPSPFRTSAPHGFDAKSETRKDIEMEPHVEAQNGFSSDTEGLGCDVQRNGTVGDPQDQVALPVVVRVTLPASNAIPRTCTTVASREPKASQGPVGDASPEGGKSLRLSEESDEVDDAQLRPVEGLDARCYIGPQRSEVGPTEPQDLPSKTEGSVPGSLALSEPAVSAAAVQCSPNSSVKCTTEPEEVVGGETSCGTSVVERTSVRPQPADTLASCGQATKQGEPLCRSRSMNQGQISFSIGSYGSYKTQPVEDIFSTEPGKASTDRFKNIKVASSPCPKITRDQVPATASKDSEICASSFEQCLPEKATVENSSGSPQVLTVVTRVKGLDDRPVECTEQPALTRTSSLLDLRNSATDECPPKQVAEKCLADEKDALLSEYAKLQLQFVAWQQQLACNQNLLENKKIVPCTGDGFGGRPERPKAGPQSGTTLPRPRPPRPLSLAIESSPTPSSGPPKVQLGSWTEHRDNGKCPPQHRSSRTPSESPKLEHKHWVNVEPVADPCRKPADGMAKWKGVSSLGKVEAKATFKKPLGIINVAPTVRGFSRESVSKIEQEIALTRKESLNERKVKAGSPEPDVPGTKWTPDVPEQNGRVVVREKPPLRESTNRVSRVNQGKPTLQEAITKCSRIPSATSSDKPSVVRATLKTGMCPTPFTNNGAEEETPKGRGTVPVADPREVLMNEIRSFGGKSSLKKVSTEPAWQLNICNVRSDPV